MDSNLGWRDRSRSATLGLLRMVAGLLMWQHGAQKLFGWFGGHPAPAFSLFWSAGVLEIVFAFLVLIGLYTRPAAFILCGEMAVAYFTQHLPFGFWAIQNHGMEAAQYCFIFLLLATAGPGWLSLDELIARRSRKKESRFAQVLTRCYPAALTLLRVASVILLWQFAVRKMFGWLGGRVARFPTAMWFAGRLEMFGGAFIALGLFTRCVAFVLSGEMAVAFWTSHYPRGRGFWPIQNGGEPAVLFCFIFLFLATAGPGALSLDGALAKRKH